jgi:hypothetical protein
MEKEKDYSASFLVFASHLDYFYSTAKKYKDDAIKIKENYPSGCTPSFHLLSSIAFELFPKVLLGYEICISHKDDKEIKEEDILKEIKNKLKEYGHKIDILYLNFPDLLKYLDINNISCCRNGYVHEYRIKLNNSKECIAIKDIEAARYGSFASNKDMATICLNDHILVDLLEKVDKYVQEKNIETSRELI